MNRHLAALRGVLKEAWRLKLMSEDDYRRAADVQGIKAERPPAGRMLSQEEVVRLFAMARDAPPGRRERDLALLALAYCCGLRRFELAGLDLADFDEATGAVTVRGKGNRVRVVYLPPGGAKLVGAWIARRGNWPGPLLRPMDRNGVGLNRRLSASAVEYLLAQLAQAAGLAAFTPHDVRRTFVSELLDRGVDLVTVQKLAGHRRPETTARYDRRGERRKQEAAALLDVPALPAVPWDPDQTKVPPGG